MLLENGRAVKEITIEEAAAMAKEFGVEPPY